MKRHFDWFVYDPWHSIPTPDLTARHSRSHVNNKVLFAYSERSKRSKLGLFSAVSSNRPRCFLTDRAAPPVFKQPLLCCIFFLRGVLYELSSIPRGLTDESRCYQRLLELCPVSKSTLIKQAKACVVWARQVSPPSGEMSRLQAGN
jgi:hypothetical protein